MAAANGYVVDKVECLSTDPEGSAFVATDKDGVDDSSGETTLFLRLGHTAAVNRSLPQREAVCRLRDRLPAGGQDKPGAGPLDTGLANGQGFPSNRRQR